MARKQPYPVLQMTGGLNVNIDPTFLVDKESPDLLNVRFDKGLIRKDLAFSNFGTGLPLDGTVLLIDQFPLQSGTTYTVLVTDKQTYKYVSANDTYSSIQDSNFTGDADNWIDSAVTLDANAADIWVLTNGKDPVKKWTGSGNIANLGGLANVAAKSLAVFKNRLILGGTTESGTACPSRIRWSVVADPEDYANTGSGFIDLVDTPDWVVGFCGLKDKLFILKERSIWELVYVGGSNVFEPSLRIDAIGTFSPHTVVTLGDELVIYGSDNIYLFDGISVEPIGTQIYPLLYETDSKIVNSSKINRAVATYIEEIKEFWLSVPTYGEIPDTLFKYNFDANSWTRKNLEITSFGFYEVPSGTPWTDLSSNWSSQTWNWLDKNLSSGAPTTLIGNYTGYVKEDDRITGDSSTMYFQTKDFTFEHASRVEEFRILAKGGPFYVSHSLDGGSSWSDSKLFPVSTAYTEYSYTINLTCQRIRFKIETTAEDLDIKWMEPWYIPRKRTKGLTFGS